MESPEQQVPTPADHHDVDVTGWRQHSFLLMVGGSVLIACVLVAISMQLYSWSGAAQLDLSLPSFNGVRSKIATDNSSSFPSTGALDAKSLATFKQLYDTQVQQTQGASGFNTQALSDDSLGIGQTQTQVQ